MPILSGFGYGSGGIQKAVVGSHTASSITPVIVGGLPAKVYRFNGSGSITFLRAGLVDILLIGPGGAAGGNQASGGAGGFVQKNNVFVSNESLSVVVGAGSTPTLTPWISGESTQFAGHTAICGGTAAHNFDRQSNTGACGAGGGNADSRTFFGVTRGHDGVEGQGLIGPRLKGGKGSDAPWGGGGGVSGNGSPFNGGPGATSNFSGSNQTYCVGGGISSGGSGQTNTGNGGSNGNGGSGVAFIRVFD
jgi:hypothetical protein